MQRTVAAVRRTNEADPLSAWDLAKAQRQLDDVAVLVAMHAAPIQSRQGQALKVIGSACLFSGNAIGLGWHEAPPAGMIGGSMAEALHGLGGLSQLVVTGAGLLAAYAAAVVAAAEPKMKRG